MIQPWLQCTWWPQLQFKVTLSIYSLVQTRWISRARLELYKRAGLIHLVCTKLYVWFKVCILLETVTFMFQCNILVMIIHQKMISIILLVKLIPCWLNQTREGLHPSNGLCYQNGIYIYIPCAHLQSYTKCNILIQN